jgi:hypothetical protein
MRDHSLNVSDPRRTRQANVYLFDLIFYQCGPTIKALFIEGDIDALDFCCGVDVVCRRRVCRAGQAG